MSQSSLSRRLMKPGPAISGGSQRSATSSERDELLGDLARRLAELSCPAAWRSWPGSRRTSRPGWAAACRAGSESRRPKSGGEVDAERRHARRRNRSRSRARTFIAARHADPCVGCFPRQRHPLGRVPEIFERVELPRLFVEQVDHDRAVVEQNPAAFAVAFDAQPVVAQLVFERVVDFVADGVELPAAVAGGEHEVVELGRQRPHVEHGDVLAAVVGGGPRGGQGELQAALAAGFEIRQGVGDRSYLGKWSCVFSAEEASILLGTAPADEWPAVQTVGETRLYNAGRLAGELRLAGYSRYC